MWKRERFGMAGIFQEATRGGAEFQSRCEAIARVRHADNPVRMTIRCGLAVSQKARLPDGTLVIWSVGFGRTSDAQGTVGRDHNPHAFTIWIAGGGMRGGDSATARRMNSAARPWRKKSE